MELKNFIQDIIMLRVHSKLTMQLNIKIIIIIHTYIHTYLYLYSNKLELVRLLTCKPNVLSCKQT